MKAHDILQHCLIPRRRDDRSTGDDVLRLSPYFHSPLSHSLYPRCPLHSLSYLAANHYRRERRASLQHTTLPLTLSPYFTPLLSCLFYLVCVLCPLRSLGNNGDDGAAKTQERALKCCTSKTVSFEHLENWAIGQYVARLSHLESIDEHSWTWLCYSDVKREARRRHSPYAKEIAGTQ